MFCHCSTSRVQKIDWAGLQHLRYTSVVSELRSKATANRSAQIDLTFKGISLATAVPNDISLLDTKHATHGTPPGLHSVSFRSAVWSDFAEIAAEESPARPRSSVLIALLLGLPAWSARAMR